MELFIELAIKYWVNALFAGIVAVCGYFIKKYIDMSKEERKKEQKEMNDNLQNFIVEKFQNSLKQSEEDDKQLQTQIDEVKGEMRVLKKGMLSMQGREFRGQCESLLDPNHVITLDEYEQIVSDHEAYNGLGGNHRGDHLFSLVEAKAKNTFGQN